MLGTLLNGLAAVPGTVLSAFRDPRLAPLAAAPPGVRWRVPSGADIFADFAAAVEEVDAVWPIAPESGGLLEALCARVEAAGRPLLNSPARAVRIAASKAATAHRLLARGLPVVPTEPARREQPPRYWPVVVKPDNGCGSEGTRLLESADEWPVAVGGDVLVQPYRKGEALSLSILCRHGEARLLSCNRMRVALRRGRFVLEACVVNALADPGGHFRKIAEGVAAALPELWGYAGIDLIRSDQGLEILEVNPRLTTSAAGLLNATGFNLARGVMELLETGRLPDLPPPIPRPVVIGLETADGH